MTERQNGTQGQLSLFAFFHINLAFSSIEVEARADVIARCYRPLLKLADTVGAIGIEATGFTLEEIHARDPAWIDDLKALVTAGKVEFIGSGYTQMIGPLVPAAVTEKNLTLGNAVYRRFGLCPTLALVNEQAYAAGLVGLYQDAGYRGLLMDWDNPAAHHHWPQEARYGTHRVRGNGGAELDLLWTDTVAFQMLQRYVHGDITLQGYTDFIRDQRGAANRAFCLYASDAEVFDYRPGRYRSEEVFDAETGSEWDRMAAAFIALQTAEACHIALPSACIGPARATLTLETPACPVPVKKQRKYNLSRWAVTGRDDITLNAFCQRFYQHLAANPAATDDDWRALCRLWASDLRTHITEKRWQDVRTCLADLSSELPPPAPLPPVPPDSIRVRHISVATRRINAILDRRRGLCLDEVSFGGPPLIGKLPLGAFADIGWQADWYTGDAVFEAPGEHKVTDLEWCEARQGYSGEDPLLYARVSTPKGDIEKFWRFSAAEPLIECDQIFHWNDWGKGVLRLGHVTLLPDAFEAEKLTLTTHNGGYQPETFFLSGEEIEHGAPVSFLVSASQGLGMTEGWAELSDGRHFIRIEVDRAVAPLMGLLTHRRLRGGLFCQFILSALELDDTRKPTSLTDAPRRFRFRIRGGDLSATC